MLVIGGVIVVVIGLLITTRNYYHASEEAIALLDSTGSVTVTEIPEGLFVDGPGTDQALIFYPGGKVEYSAYLPICYAMAENGLDCFIVKMPFNYAFFGINRADTIMDQYSYDSYVMGGHSLGGAMAAIYTSKNPEQVDELLLLAAYSTKVIPDSVAVLTIYGSQDQVLNLDKLQESAQNLPADAVQLVLEGGNHAGFGNYGAQDGDGAADISQEEQQSQTVDAVISSLEWQD